MSELEPSSFLNRFRLGKPAAMVLIIALAAAAYLPALKNGFVTDDHALITERAGILESPTGLRQLMGNVYWWGTGKTDVRHDLYRPFVSTTFWLDYRLANGSPTAFHWTNYLLHLANTGLAFLCLAPVAGTGLAFGIAALFGVGPAAVTSVGWISGRTDLWAMFFVLLFLWLFGLAVRKKSFEYSLGAALSLFLALSSKELAVIAPLLAWLLYRSGAVAPESPRKTHQFPIWYYAVLIVPYAVYFLIRWNVIGILQPRTTSAGGSWLTPLPHVAEQLLRSATLIVFPWRYGYYSEYLWSGAGERGVLFILGWIILLALIALLFIGFKRRKLWAAGGLWFGMVLLPVYALGQSWAPLSDFYVYLAIPGLWLFVLDGLRELSKRYAPRLLEKRVFISGGLTIVILTFGTLSFIRLPYLRSDFTLASAVAAAQPHSARALMGMGEEYFKQDDSVQGEQYMYRAAAADPRSIEPWKKCAAYYLDRGDINQAAPFVDTLAVLAPNSADALALIARFYYEAGHCQEAIATYQQSFKTDYPSTFTLYDYGMALLCISQDSVAAQVYRLVIQQRPFWPEAYVNLAMAYTGLGNDRAAADAYRTAIDQNPDLPAAWSGLARVSLKLGDPSAARQAAEQFFRLVPPPADVERLRTEFSQAGITLE
ncbi:MAG: tetratricopeptide repeat protein [Calditrichota bacterium]